MNRSDEPVNRCRTSSLLVLAMLLLLVSCAERPVNPPITFIDPNTGYRHASRPHYSRDMSENVVILAFSGGGMRAAAFSYGVSSF